MQDELLQFRLQKFWRLVDLPKGKHAIGTKWVYRNKKDERGIVVRNKARLVVQVQQKEDEIFISQDKYVAGILKKFDFVTVKTASTPMEPNKALLKDEEAEDVDVHLYRSMIGSLMYLTTSRSDIMFAICAYARFQYPMDSPFDLEAFSDSDYTRASLDRKSTTRGCQFLGKRLISLQCKKQTIVANSTTKAEYIAAANWYGQVLWIQNQMLDYGINFMNIKIYIDNESTICIVKNLVFHSKTKHIKIRHHFIRASDEKRPIQVIKIHTDHNVADLLTKAFDVSSDEFGVKTGICKVNAARKKVSTASTAGLSLLMLVTVGDNTAKGFSVIIMISLLVVDQHNMVACLEKSEWNADFHEIVDFLTASSVHYALTVSPTIYASYIKQFWNTTHSQTVNDVKQIHSIVDDKTIVILESSVKSDLHFNDEDEPFYDVYQTPAHTRKVFTNMKRKGKDFSGRVTSLFASMMAPPVVEGEALQEDTQLPHTSVPIPNVADKAVFKEWDDKVVRATTTNASLNAAQASGGNTPRSDEERLEQDDLTDFVPPTPHDSPLSGGHTPGSDKGRPNINELMAICTNLSNRVLDLRTIKDCSRFGDPKAENESQKLVKKQRARTPRIKLFKISTFRRKSLDKEYVSKQGRKSDKTKPMFNDSDFAKLDNVEGDAETQGRNTSAGDTVNIASINVSVVGPLNVSIIGPSISTAGDMFKDKMMTIVDTLVAIRSTRPRTTSVGKEKMVEPKEPEKIKRRDQGMDQRERVTQEEASKADIKEELDDIQAMIEADEQMATRLQSEEQEKITIEEKTSRLVEMIKERKKFFATQRNQAGYTHKQLKGRSYDEIQKLFDKSYKQIGEASGSGEEQSAEKEKELSKEELQKLLVVVLVEEVYVEALQIFSEMLMRFDRDDLVKLWDLVKEMFSITEPTDDKEKELWVELKRLFEPNNDATLWKL
ncbi:putative ribonuclease H-like domain-containing protein [Tanacetum coccineum]